jgi:DMSO reductase anchor subunit
MSSHTAYVVFTVFSQMAVGALIAMVIADFIGKEKKFFETASWVIVPAVIISLVAILSHEARPLLAMMTMSANLGSSWLSRESFTLTIFAILAVIYTCLWIFEPEYGSFKRISETLHGLIARIAKPFVPFRKPIGIIVALFGIAFLVISAKAYMMLGLPAMNHYTTPLFFIVTALLTGTMLVAAVLSIKYLMAPKEYAEPLSSYLGVAWKVVLGSVIAGIIILAGYLQILKGPAVSHGAGIAQKMTLMNILSGEMTTVFWLYVAIGFIVTVILVAAVAAFLKKDVSKAAVLSILLFATVLIGELLGRIVLFGANVPLGEVIPGIEVFYSAIGTIT